MIGWLVGSMILNLILWWMYRDASKDFWKATAIADEVIDIAGFLLSRMPQKRSPYDSPWQKPFTNPASGMGVKR